jgi:hypothetical protein
MPGRERLAATPHRFTDQRLEGWLAQAPRRIRRCQDGSAQLPPCTTLLISASRAGSPKPLEDPQMQRRGRLGATPHGPTDQRFEA